MSQNFKSALVYGTTLARLGQAIDYGRRVEADRPLLGATAAIVAVDLLDGVIARRLDQDGPTRRVTDSMVDSLIIVTGLVTTFRKRRSARSFVSALAIREIAVASGWGFDLLSSRQPKKGDVFHKLPSLSIAAFCLAANRGGRKSMMATGSAAVLINGLLAFDYFKGWSDPSRRVRLDSGVEEIAGFYDARQFINHALTSFKHLELENPNILQLNPGQDIIDLECVEEPDLA